MSNAGLVAHAAWTTRNPQAASKSHWPVSQCYRKANPFTATFERAPR